MTTLREQFPAFFPEPPICGCHYGEGWRPILDRLFEDLGKIYEGAKEVPKVAQIKEKFGGLRVYLEGVVTDAAFDRVCKAEAESTRTCEKCGAPGKIAGKGWLKCLCDPCRSENDK